MTENDVKLGLSCPNCGTFIKVVGEATALPPPKDINTQDILRLFSPATYKGMKIEIVGSHAKIELTGKYNKAKWKEVMDEVKGYGGVWVKGHFMLPLATIGLEKNISESKEECSWTHDCTEKKAPIQEQGRCTKPKGHKGPHLCPNCNTETKQ